MTWSICTQGIQVKEASPAARKDLACAGYLKLFFDYNIATRACWPVHTSMSWLELLSGAVIWLQHDSNHADNRC
jgi:hypothetical protein